MVTNNSINTQSPIQVVAGGTGQNTYNDGELLIGNSTGNTLTKNTLTAGSGITITNGSATITIASTGGDLTWTEVNTNTTMTVSTGYITNSASRLVMTVPALAAQGSVMAIAGNGSGGWTLAPNVGQTLYFNNSAITYPNVIVSSFPHDTIEIVCITANTEFDVTNAIGTGIPTGIFANGDYHSLFLKSNGSAWACGLGASGQLGNQSTVSFSSPIAVVGNHSFVEIVAGASNSFGLKANGQIWSWGANGFGELGNLTSTNTSSPVLVVGNHSFIHVYGCMGVSEFMFGLKADGSAWGCGNNIDGALGTSTSPDSSSPVLVVGNHSFIALSLGDGFALGLKSNGQIWGWGLNDSGQLAQQNINNRSSPVLVVGNHSFIALAAGNSNGYGLKADGSVWGWGVGGSGQLGNLTTNPSSSPVAVVGAHSFVAISAGVFFALGLKSDGSLWTWGSNVSGQLGNNTRTASSSPIQVVGNSFTKIYNKMGDHAGSGAGFARGFKADGSIWAWGINVYGQLANNTRTSYSSPIQMVGIP